MPHASASTRWPPSDVTQSAYSSASEPLARIASASSCSGNSTPVDVSACTTATILVAGFAASVSMIRSTETSWPKSAVSSTTSAPTRWAKSFSRDPKKPQWQLIILSPGSIRFRKPASIAEVPEDDRQIERPWEERQSACSPDTRSTRMPQKSGSRCPFIGRRIASSTSGCTLEGPGPHSSRSPGSRAGIEVTRSAMALPFRSCPGRSAGRDEGSEHRARAGAGGSRRG